MSSLSHLLLCSATHRYLHSFPTRRSSDLGVLRGGGGHQRGHGVAAEPPQLRGGLLADRGVRRVVPDRRDRKSTRLNSSHQIISYAVFCLKKKKHDHAQSGHRCEREYAEAL